MTSRTITEIQKKTSDIEVEPFGHHLMYAKLEILPQETSFPSWFLSFAEAITAAKNEQGSAKENAGSAALFTADLSALKSAKE